MVHGYGDGGGGAAVLWLVLSVNQADVIGFGPSAPPIIITLQMLQMQKKKTIMLKNCVN